MLYAMPENMKISSIPPRAVTLDEALRLNEKENYGIFRPVNEFGEFRRKTHLSKIKAWHVDMDQGTKKEQEIKINNSPLWPSRIVESKNGFHLYFNAINAEFCFHRVIVEGLNKFFGGDPRAKMVTVLLREPGFWHKKDPSHPFKVTERMNIQTRYTDEEMMRFFPWEQEKPQYTLPDEAKKSGFTESKLSDWLNGLDHEWALNMLSGSPYVGGETYSFRDVGNGHKNIYVNGKSTSCFLDKNKRIGATFGPNIFQWLRYFNHSDKQIYRIIKEVFGGSI